MANSERDERRAAALRVNLRRRKGQARESAAAVGGAADPLPADDPAFGLAFGPGAGQPRENDPAA
jgi:hypothetical protein